MIDVLNVTKKYGAFTAVKNISFNVAKGEILGFLGPNGAGKTTTMKMLTGYFPPTDGIVKIANLDISKHTIEAKKHIGYLPENVPLYHDLTVGQFLKFVADVKNVKPKNSGNEIEKVLDICGIRDVKKRLIGHLSKGYRQRVGLAQALMGDPDILILDEPTVGLDPKQIREIRDLIKSMSGKKTIVFSSHILHEVSMISDRIVVINKGEIIANDTSAVLDEKLKIVDDLVVVVRGNPEFIISAISGINGVLNVRLERTNNNESEFRVECRKGTDLRSAVIKRLASSEGVELLEIATVKMSLEEIFLKLIKTEEKDG